jgi:hypothetical protein
MRTYAVEAHGALAACVAGDPHRLLDAGQRRAGSDPWPCPSLQLVGDGAAMGTPGRAAQAAAPYKPAMRPGSDSEHACGAPRGTRRTLDAQAAGPPCDARAVGRPAYEPPMLGGARGRASAGAEPRAGKGRYSPPVGGAAGAAVAGAGPAQPAAPARCRAYWPACEACGPPVPVAGAPAVAAPAAAPRPDTPPPQPPARGAARGRGPAPAAPPPVDRAWPDDAPRRPPAGASVTAARGGAEAEAGDAGQALAFLVDMFDTVAPDLVADVLRACAGDFDAALVGLMDLQARRPARTLAGRARPAATARVPVPLCAAASTLVALLAIRQPARTLTPHSRCWSTAEQAAGCGWADGARRGAAEQCAHRNEPGQLLRRVRARRGRGRRWPGGACRRRRVGRIGHAQRLHLHGAPSAWHACGVPA